MTALARRIRYCTHCVMPETRPDLSLDADGVCDACRSGDRKDQIDWEGRFAELRELLEQHRNADGGNYDCIIPSSGGKDSHYQTYVVKHVLGLNPLCVTWTPCNQSELGRRNIRNLQQMGVDYIEVTGNPVVYRKLVRLGFELLGDCCWPEHVGIFTVPVQVAVRYRVPLLIWGERSEFEYGGPASSRRAITLDRRWMEEFGGLRGLRVEDAMHLTGLSRQDMLPYLYPSEEELATVGVKGIFLGLFLRWDARKQLEVIRRYGFNVNESGPQEGTYTNYENLDCKYVGIHDYLMYCKYGFGRTTAHACIDIRNKRLSREEAMRLVRRYDGSVPRRYLAEFLREMDMTEDDFFKICDVFTNKSVFVADDAGGPIRDAEGNLVKINWDNDDSDEEIGERLALGRRPLAPPPAAPQRAAVTIVDYGMGNLRSVAKAFETLGYKVLVTGRPEDLEMAERIVLPGVGAFGDGMRQLSERGLVAVLRHRVLEDGVPFLGICLGMQLLADRGRENGIHAGLGWIAGETVAIVPSDPLLKVPHIGWNDVTRRGASTLFKGLAEPLTFYFVHGYHLQPSDPGVVTVTVDYDGALAAAIERENLFGTQFHPEKSQRAGLAVLRNFMTV
jgi:imidazole glycerol phosphate synthase glutamine amidotransferase subunit